MENHKENIHQQKVTTVKLAHFLPLANTDDRQQSAGKRSLFAVAEEQVGAAGGAGGAGEDILRTKAGGQELRTIRFAQIKVNISWSRLVPRWRHVEPLEGIRLLAGTRLIKIVRRIRKLRCKFQDEVRTDFIAASADGRPERGEEIARIAAALEAQAAHGFFGDAAQSAAPSGVHRGDGAFCGIDNQNRYTIRGLNTQEKPGAI